MRNYALPIAVYPEMTGRHRARHRFRYPDASDFRSAGDAARRPGESGGVRRRARRSACLQRTPRTRRRHPPASAKAPSSPMPMAKKLRSRTSPPTPSGRRSTKGRNGLDKPPSRSFPRPSAGSPWLPRNPLVDLPLVAISEPLHSAGIAADDQALSGIQPPPGAQPRRACIPPMRRRRPARMAHAPCCKPAWASAPSR